MSLFNFVVFMDRPIYSWMRADDSIFFFFTNLIWSFVLINLDLSYFYYILFIIFFPLKFTLVIVFVWYKPANQLQPKQFYFNIAGNVANLLLDHCKRKNKRESFCLCLLCSPHQWIILHALHIYYLCDWSHAFPSK